MSGKTWYCPVCGMSKQSFRNTICDWCKNEIQMVESIHPHLYYVEKAQQVYNKAYNFDVTEEEKHNILLEEAKNNPLFNEEIAKQSFEKWKSQTQMANQSYFNNVNQPTKQNQPKCPTCSSTNIQKISTTSKVAGAAMFGLFSKTARSQFKCNNCGYKW